ncbi:uncharacterized protein LOC134669947 isoform X2 [Cydia fagiglandana]|uniref:uncharacterized protein LOC134669947 isoform X2 n=1 Tax=Cydia fagiglandana TaxID=1458189 RepID=UPI002FEE14B2
MNDPWDVKSRQVGQYVSCMKINGVPLLPPLLSKECRKEMQYYKLLAKEVEKRIVDLKAYVSDSEEDSAQDNTDAPELLQDYEQPHDHVQQILQVFDSNMTTFREDKLEETLSASTTNTDSNSPDLCNTVSSSNASYSLPKFSVNSLQNEISNSMDKINSSQHTPQPIEPPERDCNTTPKKITEVEKLTDDEISFDGKKPEREIVDLLRVEFDISKVEPLLSGVFPDMTMTDGPASLGSKSFTGSLNNIHSESVKDAATLVRQSSYTVLNPSPMLLAHLKVQSLSTGVEVTSISMSDSLSNLNTPKKRRSWDLESAKIKWSSMAHELKQKTAQTKPVDNKNLSKSSVKKPQQTPNRSKSVCEKPRRPSLPGKALKSEPVQNQKTKKCTPSPYADTNSTNVKELKANNNTQPSPKKLISECEDPATKVKELYERIQNQQLLQMANLVEKQKREQMLLQQVFDEQNSILYRQLKTICPKSPVEAKAAWADKVDRGPVSLSQLINHKSPDSLTSTLTDTHNNLNKCAEVLKMSKDISGSIKKQNQPGTPTDGSRTRTHSPKRTRTSRKLSYDTSSSDREFEPILTDRTNDTLAGLNVTFTSDSDEPTFMEKQTSKHSAVRSVEHSVKVPARLSRPVQSRLPPTPEQLAAASTIVAHAKGYLVRRLLRTERVQATVQTIKDALLCALQMHQDRAGIRGADVDLHRRLIQQITAACYSLHDTFVASTPAERCALIAADRERRRQKPTRPYRTDIMSQSHSGAFPARVPRSSAHSMTQSHHGNAH